MFFEKKGIVGFHCMKCKIIIITIIDHEIVWFDQWHMIAFTHYMCRKMILYEG
jgi:hypothetical protein